MDWKHLLSLSPHNLDDVRKDGAAIEIANLSTEQKLDSRSCKKLFRLAQVALKFRNEQVKHLQQKLVEGKDDFGSQERIKEWKRTIEKLEMERHTLRTKLKETTEENAKLQSKFNAGVQFGSEGEDSPDALSEIERQQELYNNISMKNKHIKRLLRDIDDLEKRSSFQVDTINGLQLSLNDATLSLTALTHQYEELQARCKEQQESILKMNEKIVLMESEITTICEEKENLLKELNSARRQHDDQIAEWEDQFDEREKELNQLKDRYDDLLSQFPGIDIEAERREYKLMSEKLQSKDDLIVDLEQKILTLSQEMYRSTEVMNRISEEKLRACKEKSKESHCCLEFRAQLEKANERCREMQEILTGVEEDNRLKSRQAVEAIEALRRYENGEEGLASTLRKNVRLQEKVASRDKQIRELIAEINLANDIAIENAVLRKRLGLDDDEVVATSSILARQKKIAKVNERLALKLRASEEMRLQLKLEKNDLKRKLAAVTQQTQKVQASKEEGSDTSNVPQDQLDAIDVISSIHDPSAIKFCESCTKQYNIYDSMKHCRACSFRHNFNYCDKCVGQLKMNFDDGQPINQPTDKSRDRLEELERQYLTVLEENENLRMGMHEILEKLREYDAMSDQLTIDRTMLEKLLNALNVRPASGWYQTTGMRLQGDLLSAQESDLLLKDRLAMDDTPADGRKSKSIQSTESVNDSGNVCNEDDNSEPIDPLPGPEQLDFSEQVLLKAVEIDRLTETLEQLRSENGRLVAAQDELQVTQKLYNELLNITRASENEKDRLLVETVDRLKDIESTVCIFQRKVDYLKTDNDNLHNTLRSIKGEYLNLLHDLRLELVQKKNNLDPLEPPDVTGGDSLDSTDLPQIEKLESEVARLKLEATNFYTIFLKNIAEVDKDQQLDVDYAKLNQFGLVDTNLSVEFITKDEYRRIRERLDKLERELQREIVKNGHLEELLQVSNEQIRSQQSLISKYSEDEVSLRHLVVDLQSASNEKYLLARAHKELDVVREQEENLKLENGKMKQKFLQTLEQLDLLKQRLEDQKQEFDARVKDNVLKIRFLKKSLQQLTTNYSTCAPTFAITDFIKMYTHVLEIRHNLAADRTKQTDQWRDAEYERIFAKLQSNMEGNNIQDKINLIKYESQSEYLTRQLIFYQEQVDQLQSENKQLRLQEIENTRHWDTLEVLFGEDAKKCRKDKDRFFDKEVQVSVETSSKCINTIPIIEEVPGDYVPRIMRSSSSDTIHGGDDKNNETQPAVNVDGDETPVAIPTFAQKSLESQLKQAMMLASTRSALLLEAESRLSECQGRIKLLEKSLEEKESLLKKQAQAASTSKQDHVEDSILSSTIGSLQNLLLEKDTTLSRYQELLKSERTEHSQVYDENMTQIRGLKKTIDELEQKLYEKQKEFDNVTTQLNDMNRLKALQENVPEKQKNDDDAASRHPEPDAIVYTDKIIENIYEIDEKKEREIEELRVQVNLLESSLQESEKEQKRLQLQLRESCVREKKSEKMLREKESELTALNERISKEANDLREFTESIASAQEIEQLKEMLEEKDRHIQDLTETLTQFHEDQRNFMNDTSLHSAEQVSQLSADLNRSEASNRVLKTQIEALKRQIVSIQQREKQSRELVKTLKNQLIKRPVIAMKADRLPTPREDQLARRVQQLETELIDTKDELRKQTAINENRRAKTAAELDLWNKQKRWQQMAERLKVQLKERELELEKLKVHFNTAKTTIARMERDRPRGAVNSGAGGGGMGARSGSVSGGDVLLEHKYQPAESPDQYCSTDSTVSEDTSITTQTTQTQIFSQNSKGIIDALKSRIESQQRRIIAMELDRKGSNTVTHELEKMQEKLCNLESQNVRLEAKTLQLQLDNDMLRQSDESDRLRRQIKHLEEYVIVLKEELSKATVGCAESINFENLCVRCSRRSGQNDLAERNANLEQTVLTLKRMIEKLRVENKHLKDHRARERSGGSADTTPTHTVHETIAKELYDRLKKEHEKLQQSNGDLLNKVSVLQVEIELLSSVSCTRCKVRCDGAGEPTTATSAMNVEENAVQEELRDKLEKKSQLLEKAKILLQRAAAKERYLKEQIDLLRRKCSDLQNVPVIDEISE
ncbi:centrosomal protein cep290 [Anopheles ziemanni]|uniref:centrosomal protein cep290 n=1 Tax=Anopheles coustani TaxID=139045 RepID=UPI002658D724|nr:centrosomal protein cep290 [Anopheles coustani]XP_058171340.1 centrosomal protein cep290 [Anopheles ziemanni]